MMEAEGMRAARQGGVALILAIFTCVILVVLAVGVAGLVRVELLASRGSFDRMQARYLAQAGFNLARSVLMYQDEDTEENTFVDGPEDKWFALENEPPLELGAGRCRMVVVDACSRININTANEAILTKVFNDSELAAAIVQWRLDHGKFFAVGDLLQVAGMTPETLKPAQQWLTAFSLESNSANWGQPRLNLNNPRLGLEELQRLGRLSPTESRRVREARNARTEHKFTSWAQVPLPPDRIIAILNRVSLSDAEFVDGRINLNTAPREVLEFLPGLTPEFIEALIEKRSQPGGALRYPGELLMLTPTTFPKLPEEGYKTLIDVICVKSSSFIIESEGELTDRPARCILQGLVVRVWQHPQVLFAPLHSGLRELSQTIFLTESQSE